MVHAGLFGFTMDMHAISSLYEPGSEDNLNVRSLLDSTAEICNRGRLYARWWRLWRADVRAGWVAFGRFKVGDTRGVQPALSATAPGLLAAATEISPFQRNAICRPLDGRNLS